MSLGQLLLGAAWLGATVAPVALGAQALRRRALPSWSGPPAWLADTALALALFLVTALVLGAVGLFRRGALVAGAVTAGLATTVCARRLRPDGDAAASDAPVPPVDRLASVGALGVVTLVVAQWTVHTAAAVTGGITEPDSIHYHLPFAARFAQEGWTTRLHLTIPEFPTWFYPANGELLHGTGMALLGRDVLSPLLNMG